MQNIQITSICLYLTAIRDIIKKKYELQVLDKLTFFYLYLLTYTQASERQRII